jgi:hypothetical protein
MNIREFTKPLSAKALNESLAQKFGEKLKLDHFTLEQLQDVRNKLRTKVFTMEQTSDYGSLDRNESYQKTKLFIDTLHAEISERESIAEGGKPDFLDLDKDGNKKEPMKKAAKDAKKKKANESIIKEGEEDKAELVMAAKDMVDRVTGWMEDTAEMQAESMLELGDAIRDEMGSEQSEQFIATVKPGLESLYSALESTRSALTNGVAMLTGEGGEAPAPEMGEEPLPPEEGGEEGDEFAAAPAAAGGEEPAGREARESVQRKGKALAENSRKLATLLSKKK